MGPPLARHDALIETTVGRHGCRVVRPRGDGDSRFAVVARASAAVAAAAEVQRAFHAEPLAHAGATARAPGPAHG